MITAAEILAVTEFTTPVTLPDGTTTPGIFDTETNAATLGIGIHAQNPQITIATEIADHLEENQQIRINNKDHLIGPRTTDGAGLTTIELLS